MGDSKLQRMPGDIGLGEELLMNKTNTRHYMNPVDRHFQVVQVD